MFQMLQHFALLLVGAVMAVLGAGAQDVRDVSGTWTAELRNGQVFLQVRTSAPGGWDSWRGDWNMGESLPIEEFSGLPASDERFTAANVKFELHREAGALAFDGAFRDGRGAGLFTFQPRAEYVAEMKDTRTICRSGAASSSPSTTSARNTSRRSRRRATRS